MPEALAAVRAGLADRYTIDRELGRGGAATVYLAQDLKHGRQVALKILRPDVAAALGADRFLREIEIAARLSHPHILPLHESGAAGGFLYYVMPYVDGESLRQRIDREKQLPVDEAVRIARQVASALTYSHSHDVVHRDIKPENILLSAGEAVVADFGIARAVAAAGGARLTETGISIGTPAYMSPEQTLGQGELDGRSDVYSLGCVVYEMLAGSPPFGGATAQQVMARHALDPVPPLRTIRPDLPESVARAVHRALAKTPADRFPSAAAFGEALTKTSPPVSPTNRFPRRSLLVVGFLAVMAAGYYVATRTRTSGPGPRTTDSIPSIAVLAFTNVGGDSINEPFSDGMADELTTALGKVEGLSVVARTSAFGFKGKGLTPVEIGGRLQVRYIVDGQVRRAVNQIRVGAVLIDVATGKELWAGDFDHDARNRDVFAVQDSITRSIVRQLRLKLSAELAAGSTGHRTENAEAHDLYLRGRYFFKKRDDQANLEKAQEYFEQAIRLDSNYALAYSGLSDAYSHSSLFGYVSPEQAFPKAKAAVRTALSLDSLSVEAHTSMGVIALFYDWDVPAAGRQFDRALELNPRDPSARLFHHWYLLASGRLDDAVNEVREALSLDPFDSILNARLASALFYARRFEEALGQGRRLREIDPTRSQVGGELGQAYLGQGQCAAALDAIGRTRSRSAVFVGVRGFAYGRCGRRVEALEEIARLQAEANAGRYVSHFTIATIYAGLGDKDRAFAALDSAFVEHAWPMFTLSFDPLMDGLRADPRFAVLLQKVGLASARKTGGSADR